MGSVYHTHYNSGVMVDLNIQLARNYVNSVFISRYRRVIWNLKRQELNILASDVKPQTGSWSTVVNHLPKYSLQNTTYIIVMPSLYSHCKVKWLLSSLANKKIAQRTRTKSDYIPQTWWLYASITMITCPKHDDYMPQSRWLHAPNTMITCLKHDDYMPQSRWLHAPNTMITCLNHDDYMPQSRWLHASITMITCPKHDDYMPQSRWLHASITMITCPKHDDFLQHDIAHIAPWFGDSDLINYHISLNSR